MARWRPQPISVLCESFSLVGATQRRHIYKNGEAHLVEVNQAVKEGSSFRNDTAHLLALGWYLRKVLNPKG